MFGLFGKSNPKAKLEKQYKKLLEESHRLSTIDRAKSDKVRAEAEEVIKQIEELEKSGK
ncbi:Lacal_2735 family protein [Cryomorpha ignava]|uniref:Lacal_2735 family protein n=1 Tax=Cryomorpha ignava TaxID=101383 RepID=A0A7K3WKA6_9FLAO|nr:Lacal_2735 family protein [Cryomorpha ignava]NEN22080.1 Lacal_2735 family protein [Cryomorpha ignava]